ILERPPPPFDKRLQYGQNPLHFAELRLPDGQGPFPFLFVIHGGFWQSAYDLSHIGHLCAALPAKESSPATSNTDGSETLAVAGPERFRMSASRLTTFWRRSLQIPASTRHERLSLDTLLEGT